jgi:hypothetical protein
MQGIYITYIPERKHLSKEYNVAAILSLLFMAPISLVHYYYYYHHHHHHLTDTDARNLS